jgi:hypothetical protein
MKSRMAKSLVFMALALTVILAGPALAEVVNYGTGIHHWVIECGPYPPDGHGSVEIVSMYACPPYVPSLPDGCRCMQTPYDFPVGNPYPAIRIQTAVDNGDPGHIHVILDQNGVIQCGSTVEPTDQDPCGSPYNIVPADPKQVNPNTLRLMDSLRPDIQEKTGVPVDSFTYWYAQPQTQSAQPKSAKPQQK